MSKEYGYFEAMEEILKDKSKKFKENIWVIFFNEEENLIKLSNTTDELLLDPCINDSWINTKWTLIEEKNKYNIRVYNVDSGRLISSENKIMTEEEKNIYCESKVIWMLTIPIDEKSSNPFVFNMSPEELNYINSKEAITRVICEEIVTT